MCVSVCVCVSVYKSAALAALVFVFNLTPSWGLPPLSSFFSSFFIYLISAGAFHVFIAFISFASFLLFIYLCLYMLHLPTYWRVSLPIPLLPWSVLILLRFGFVWFHFISCFSLSYSGLTYALKGVWRGAWHNPEKPSAILMGI